jgi:nucleotide-binding universal stress UspA family protein
MAEEQAHEILSEAEAKCKTLAQEVKVTSLSLTNAAPWEGIIAAAEQIGADLIFMASHGRRGISGLLLGSETQKVLTHSTIPVLVYR